MMPYLSCKKIENDVYNFPTWQYCKYKDIFDSRIIINSTVKFYISISYQKDLLSIDTIIFKLSKKQIRDMVFLIRSPDKAILFHHQIHLFLYHQLSMQKILLFQTHIFRQLRKSPGFFLIKTFSAQIPIYQYFAFYFALDFSLCSSFTPANLDSLGNAHLF